VKRGKLYPEQGQIGGQAPVRRDDGALPGPRVGRTSRRATGGHRWMTVAAGRARGTELGLQAVSLALTLIGSGRPGQSSSARKMCGAVQALQIGVAAGRSPRGIGRRRSGNRHSTS
jgi:hypothetical protein